MNKYRLFYLLLFSTLLLFTEYSHAQQSKNNYKGDLYPYRIGDKWGYVSSGGKVIIPIEYDEASKFIYDERTGLKNIAFVKKGGKYAYIKKDGTFLTDFEFDKADYFYDGTAEVAKGGERYCIDSEGKKTTGCSGGIGCISPMTGKMYHVDRYQKNNKTGIINIKEVILNGYSIKGSSRDTMDAVWDDLIELDINRILVKQNNKWGIIDYNYNFITPLIYDEVILNNNGNYRSIVKQNNKYGFINKQGEVVVPIKYHKVEMFFGSRYTKVWLDDYFWGYINDYGKEYFEQ